VKLQETKQSSLQNEKGVKKIQWSRPAPYDSHVKCAPPKREPSTGVDHRNHPTQSPSPGRDTNWVAKSTPHQQLCRRGGGKGKTILHLIMHHRRPQPKLQSNGGTQTLQKNGQNTAYKGRTSRFPDEIRGGSKMQVEGRAGFQCFAISWGLRTKRWEHNW